jgi:hypothetical protein
MAHRILHHHTPFHTLHKAPLHTLPAHGTGVHMHHTHCTQHTHQTRTYTNPGCRPPLTTTLSHSRTHHYQKADHPATHTGLPDHHTSPQAKKDSPSTEPRHFPAQMGRPTLHTRPHYQPAPAPTPL